MFTNHLLCSFVRLFHCLFSPFPENIDYLLLSMRLLICWGIFVSSIYTYLPSFVRLFVCLFVCSFVRSFVRLFVCLFVCSFVRSFVRSFVHIKYNQHFGLRYQGTHTTTKVHALYTCNHSSRKRNRNRMPQLLRGLLLLF